MKKIFVGTSWKMNKTLAEAMTFCQTLKEHMPQVKSHIQPFVIPPFTAVREVSKFMLEHQVNCLTGVQNMHYADQGAFTGEISPLMVKDTGAVLVEMGHSERREFFGETDLTVHKKVYASLKHDLCPLVCIGDSAQDKEWGVSGETVIKQMKAAIAGLSANEVTRVIIAYEPIWAIGEHGVPATPEEAEQIHAALRAALVELYGTDIANQIVILYGGSVNQENASALITQPNIDGLFIGRSAWQAEGFCKIIATVSELS
ncbi:triose-phosphate isomerase [Zophobihabitans entericus]|uniref:Triosephosphate isomerase n=1 Tax=Zophobihabitans entericus TaxID=1635327 RepID=A0A6G9IA02_9GAMM|nr:triose-phosphate isomerase [Zophobihabitans entericus]QIQ21046.1 triose-phosphate isomerase [Zophobihabitans entericus]